MSTTTPEQLAEAESRADAEREARWERQRIENKALRPQYELFKREKGEALFRRYPDPDLETATLRDGPYVYVEGYSISQATRHARIAVKGPGLGKVLWARVGGGYNLKSAIEQGVWGYSEGTRNVYPEQFYPEGWLPEGAKRVLWVDVETALEASNPLATLRASLRAGRAQ